MSGGKLQFGVFLFLTLSFGSKELFTVFSRLFIDTRILLWLFIFVWDMYIKKSIKYIYNEQQNIYDDEKDEKRVVWRLYILVQKERTKILMRKAFQENIK